MQHHCKLAPGFCQDIFLSKTLRFCMNQRDCLLWNYTAKGLFHIPYILFIIKKVVYEVSIEISHSCYCHQVFLLTQQASEKINLNVEKTHLKRAHSGAFSSPQEGADKKESRGIQGLSPWMPVCTGSDATGDPAPYFLDILQWEIGRTCQSPKKTSCFSKTEKPLNW